jgi:NAD(P)H-hydrate repair Nnr-like enzyme with NAD(P)H-hydrate dehydratase domain
LRIITPHPGEAARLLNSESRDVQNDRPAALRKLSESFGNCWVVLKGHQTLVGQASGPVYVNSSGNPFLAQGGSGDLLAGFMGGLLAQPALQNDPGQALRYAVWAHGTAADRLCEMNRAWTVEDLAGFLG